MAGNATLKAIIANARLSGGANPYDPADIEYDAWQTGLELREDDKTKAPQEQFTKTGRLKKPKKSRAINYTIATTDFETDPAKQGRAMFPFAWGFYDGSTYREHYGNDAVNSLVDYIRCLPCPHIIFAHNGGKFDFQFLVPFLEGDILFIGSRIVKAHIKGLPDPVTGKPMMHVLRDSAAMMPVKLADAGEKDHFDYSLMEAGVRDKHKKAILKYLRQDCVGLYDTVQLWLKAFGPRHLTMASAAMEKLNLAMAPQGMDEQSSKAFRVYERMSPEQDAVLRPFYFGGRVECFKTGLIKAPYGSLKVFDITSSYPYCMKEFLHPVGAGYIVTRDITEDTDFVCVDAWSNGALPIRQDDGSLAFPVGRGTFNTTIHEVRAGLETGRLKIHKILSARGSPKKSTFADFIDTYFALRNEAKANGDKVFDLFWKLVMNGAYGKFAQNPRNFKDRVIVQPDQEPPSEAHGWRRDVIMPEMEIWARPTEEYYPGSLARSFLNLGTGASITGAARANLLRGLSAATNPLYCDTDSIICEDMEAGKFGVEMNGKKLGGWKLEATGDSVAICGKKLYAFFGDRDADEAVNAKRIKEYGDARCIKLASKGVRLSAQDMLRVAEGETVTYTPEFPSLKPDGRQVWQSRDVKRTGTK